MFKTLLGSFFLREKIKTTLAKAKEIQPMAEKLISKTKNVNISEKRVAVIRELKKQLPNVAVQKLAGDFSKRFADRKSGHTRILKLGRRISDGAEMAIIEIV